MNTSMIQPHDINTTNNGNLLSYATPITPTSTTVKSLLLSFVESNDTIISTLFPTYNPSIDATFSSYYNTTSTTAIQSTTPATSLKSSMTTVLNCCLERLFQDKEITDIKTGEEMENFLVPCQHHHQTPETYVRDIFQFYLHPDTEEMQCRSVYCENVQLSNIQVFYTILLIVTLVVGILGNSLVCIVIYSSKTLRKRTTNYFLFSLAVVDLLCALLVIPIKIAKSMKAGFFCMSVEMCYFYKTVDPIAFLASITHLFVICIDRFVAIDYPYRHQSMFYTRNVKITIACIWCYAITLGLLNTFNWNLLEFKEAVYVLEFRCRRVRDKYPVSLDILGFVVPCIVMAILYSRIWYIAMSQDMEIRKLRINDVNNNYSNNHSKNGSRASLQNNKVSTLNTSKFIIAARVLELRATKVIIVVFGTYFLCWAPLITMVIIDSLGTRIELGKALYTIVCEYLPNLNSALNPFIYCLLHKDFQKVLLKLMERIPYVSALKSSLQKRRRGDVTTNVDVGSESNNLRICGGGVSGGGGNGALDVMTSVCDGNSESFL